VREIFEFRIPEPWACEWLEAGDGKTTRSGSVRIVTALKDSDLFSRVLSAEKERRKTNDRLFVTWSVRREYTAHEIEAAELFLLDIFNVFEPAGEELGAVYLPDVEGPAEFANRIGPLVLKCSRFRGNSLCQSIAGEKLAAPEFQRLIRQERFTGVDFGPVICNGAEMSKRGWAELIITSPKINIAARTRIGVDPLELGPRGGTGAENIGMNVLSEVSIERESWDGSDFATSKQTLGALNGLLRPRRLLFVSQRLFKSLTPPMKRGLRFEIVRFDNGATA
jgi:hypothetical protein